MTAPSGRLGPDWGPVGPRPVAAPRTLPPLLRYYYTRGLISSLDLPFAVHPAQLQESLARILFRLAIARTC